MLNFDQLANVPAEDVLQATYEALDILQGHPPHVQAAAAATLFVALTQALKVDAQDVMTVISNLFLNERTGRIDQHRALLLYIEHELKNR